MLQSVFVKQQCCILQTTEIKIKKKTLSSLRLSTLMGKLLVLFCWNPSFSLALVGHVVNFIYTTFCYII